jgi:hypothetical protein
MHELVAARADWIRDERGILLAAGRAAVEDGDVCVVQRVIHDSGMKRARKCTLYETHILHVIVNRLLGQFAAFPDRIRAECRNAFDREEPATTQRKRLAGKGN